MSSLEKLKNLKDLFQNAHLSTDEDSDVLLKSIRDKLFSIFCSPMKEEFTHEAFRWVSQLCMSVGDFSWISTDNNWSSEEVKIFSCIVRLSINELHILVPLIERHLTSGQEPDVEDGKVLARSAESEEYDRFGDHLVIIESVVKSLVKDQQPDDDDVETNLLTKAFKAEELVNLLNRLKEASTLICDYLELVYNHWNTLTKQLDDEKFSSAEGALRIMCVWLSEDPVGFESQSKRFLIDLIIKNLLLSSRQHDILILALHSVCTQNEELLSILKQIPSHREALQKYLDYVEAEQSACKRRISERRSQKMFKLRCGLVKDLMKEAIWPTL